MSAIRPSNGVQRRIAELGERRSDGRISAEEQSELDEFLLLEHIPIMAKARARQYVHLDNGGK